MQYLLSVYSVQDVPNYLSEQDMQQAFKQVDALNKEIRDAGIWVFGGGLQPAETATTVSFKDGENITTDGPFAETKEQIGGFWIIDVPDLDEALQWAAKGSEACMQPVEVRPFQPEPEQ